MTTASTREPVLPGTDVAAVRRAIASTPRPEPAGAWASAAAFGWRGMLKVKHVPEQLIDVTTPRSCSC
jgi:ABC-2 type transport system permease protein